MSRFLVLTILLTLAMDFGSASTIVIVSQPYLIPSQQVTRSDSLAGTFGSLPYSVDNPSIVRQKRAFDTYICGVFYAPHTSIFDFGGGGYRGYRGFGRRGRYRNWG